MMNTNEDFKRIIGESRLIYLNKMSRNNKIEFIREIASEMPNGKDLSIVQARLVDLMKQQRDSLEFPCEIMHPSSYDIVIDDITARDIDVIEEELGTIALHNASDITPTFPVEGILYGTGCRTFLPMIVSKCNVSIHVHFLYDTGSPYTYLRAATFAALGYKESVPSDANVVIHGTAITAHLASGHFDDVDLLGQDFMVASRAIVLTDYPLRTCSVNVEH